MGNRSGTGLYVGDHCQAIEWVLEAGKLGDGWKPLVSFEDGIRITVRWYLDHKDWMQHVVSGDYLKFYEKTIRIVNFSLNEI